MGQTSYYAEAPAEVLADSEAYADWQYAECHGKKSQKWPHMVEASAEDFSHVDVCKLVSLMNDFGQPAIVTQAARDAIVNRYLNEKTVRERIACRALILEKQAAEDERKDREELEAQFRRVMDWGPSVRVGEAA